MLYYAARWGDPFTRVHMQVRVPRELYQRNGRQPVGDQFKLDDATMWT